MVEVYQGKTVPSQGVSAGVRHSRDALSVGRGRAGADGAGVSLRPLTFPAGGGSQPASPCPHPELRLLPRPGGGRGDTGRDIKVRMPRAWEMELGFPKQPQAELKPLVLKEQTFADGESQRGFLGAVLW